MAQRTPPLGRGGGARQAAPARGVEQAHAFGATLAEQAALPPKLASLRELAVALQAKDEQLQALAERSGMDILSQQQEAAQQTTRDQDLSAALAAAEDRALAAEVEGRTSLAETLARLRAGTRAAPSKL